MAERTKVFVIESGAAGLPPDDDEHVYLDGGAEMLPENERPTERQLANARWINEQLRLRRERSTGDDAA
jgi:hypothetical protein